MEPNYILMNEKPLGSIQASDKDMKGGLYWKAGQVKVSGLSRRRYVDS
jgi:hypothetical protein